MNPAINKLSQKRSIRKGSFLKLILKESRLFIIFSFLACSLPIIFSLIASLIKPDGSQAVLAIGYVVPFLMAFLQISFTVAMIIVAQQKKANLTITNHQKQLTKDHQDFWSTFWLSIIMGLISVVFYILSAFLYIYFANNKPNTQATLKYGLNFIWSTILFIFLIPLIMNWIIFIFTKNKNQAILITIIFFIFMIGLGFILGPLTKLKVTGIGIGISLAAIFTITLEMAYLWLKQQWIFYNPFVLTGFNLTTTKLMFKESLTTISLSLFKGVAILGLAFAIPFTISDFVPLSYQMSRVLWFNMMYFIPFLGIGIGEAIRFHYLFHSEANSCQINHCLKNDLYFILITLVFTLLISVGAIFMINPLAFIYSQNDDNPFVNNLAPEIAGWGQPSVPPHDLINLDELNKLQLDPFPQLQKLIPLTGDPEKDKLINLQNATIKLANLKKLTDWLDVQIKNNPVEIKHLFQNLNQWNQWLNQTNNQGIKLIDFLNQKFNINLKNSFDLILQSIIKGDDQWKNEINQLVPFFKSSMSYLVYLWLYSTTDPTVTSAFINLRFFVDAKDLFALYTENGQLNLQKLLAENSIRDLLPILFLKIQTFNAKSMIYILIFANLNAIWSILLQTNTRDLKKSLPYWLMVLVYFVCIGGLVTFGALFGVTFKESLGNANPFQYLDAWTFPLVLIAILAITVVLIKAIQANIYVRKNKINS